MSALDHVRVERLTLVRLNDGPDATVGMLLWAGEILCLTLERPWENNRRDHSSVPCGPYLCGRHRSARHGDTWRLRGVPGRDGILFHTGNRVTETQGCILVGLGLADGDETIPRLSASRVAHARFMHRTRTASALELVITRSTPCRSTP